jgi:hypothetical protein
MAESAEGTRLLSEYGAKVPSRVRIPVSPPPVTEPGFHTRVFNPARACKLICAATRLSVSATAASTPRLTPDWQNLMLNAGIISF